MKLLACHKCNDVFSLLVREERKCRCGSCGGQYTDHINAEVWGMPGQYSVLGFNNTSLVRQMCRQRDEGDSEDVAMYGGKLQVMGRPFDAFIIPFAAPSVERKEIKQ